MKNIILLFLFLIPAFLFAQYPATGNKQRLGYQTTGDGLIWRGVAADTVTKPRTTANAYFQLDTVNGILRRYIATLGKWQTVGGGINIDSLIYATRYWVGSNFFPLQGGTLTGTGGAGFIGLPSQVTAPGTPASGLNVYAQGSSFNWKGTDGYERLFASTLTGGRTYTLPDVSGTFALGSGTANRVPLWAAANTLGFSNIQDNGTAVSILNSKPFQFGQWTTSGRPTGVNGYKGRNTTTGFDEGYFTSQWENYITSTGASANQVPYFTSEGKIAGSTNLTYNNTSKSVNLYSNPGTNDRGFNVTHISRDISAGAIRFRKQNGSISSPSIATNNSIIGAFSFQAWDGAEWPLDLSFFGASLTGSISTGIIPTSLFFVTGSDDRHYEPDLLVHHTGNIGIGESGNGSIVGTITVPARQLTVYGETRITDLTTDTPTQFVGADSDGDLGAISFNSVWRDYQTDKAILGSDSSFVHDTANDSTYVKGNTRIQTGNLTIEKTSGTPYLNIIAKGTSGNQEAGIYMKSRGNFGSIIEFDVTSGSSASKLLGFYNYNTARGGQTIFFIGSELGQFGARSIGTFSVYDSIGTTLNFSARNNGTILTAYGTGTKEAADLSKTESVYNAVYATDGTLLEKRANTEQYNNITSTTSPVTLSSTISDNLINQGSTQATFTLNMPASPVDGQVLYITFNNAITTLTIDGNGNTIVGSAVTTGVAGSQRKFKFYSGIGWIKQY